MSDMLQLVVSFEEDCCESQRQAEAYRTSELSALLDALELDKTA